MKSPLTQKEILFFRLLLALVLIVIAVALRVAPHPLNFTPIGAIALFSGAVIRDRRIAFLFPLLALFVGDVFVGFHKLMAIVYASFLLSVLIGRLLQNRRTIPRIAGATLLGSVQFFLITNFAVWQILKTYSHDLSGLLKCYVAAIPLFWNTLAGDAVYVAVFFLGFGLAENLFPALREPAPQK